MSHIAVVIMTKLPYPGQVKTRLCPPLTPVQAAALSRAFIFDKLTQVRALTAIRPALAYAPASGEDFFADIAPEFTLVAQQGAGLGERLLHVLEYFFSLGDTGVLLTDSDTPHLPPACLQQAVALLATPTVDVVLGPSDDGGYYCIGVHALHHELFLDMPWSTSAVLAETVQRAAVLGLRVAQLPTCFDIDTPDDLMRLRTTLAQIPGPEPQHTRHFLREHL
ncbi:MAG: glycosyltransferase [Candidatus Tectomicrobia bacterium]|uniref:Glycosyltransferase n=1 Tax=Tectimicrobiota bacterium TaxID=2528274 RepID=A0A938B169_UNCTE|nr:glycosyltransferase [Candidatus Tectomicrobia bacterium]